MQETYFPRPAETHGALLAAGGSSIISNLFIQMDLLAVSEVTTFPVVLFVMGMVMVNEDAVPEKTDSDDEGFNRLA